MIKPLVDYIPLLEGKPLSKKHAFVTGAHGFLGRHVAKIFSENGYVVTGLGHGTWSQSEREKWGVSYWYSCDITLESLQTYIQQPDVVVHCAGSGSVGFSIAHPMQDFERTVTTTLITLEYLRLNYPKTSFIYPSSAAVYGVVNSLPIVESGPLNPISPYGVHKKIAEELIQSYAKQFSIPFAIVRFFSLYGSGIQKQLLWDTCTKVQKKDYEFFGTGNEVRDWLHVIDAARLIFTLSSSASPDGITVNGGTGVGITVSTIISMVVKKMNLNFSPSFSHIKKNGDPPGYIADIRKSSALGWEPKITLDEGIDDYVKWFKAGVL